MASVLWALSNVWVGGAEEEQQAVCAADRQERPASPGSEAGQADSHSCCSPMIEVSIPSMEREVDESGKSKKRFRVEVLFNGRKHYVLRTSSEFQTLHRKLRKIIQTPDFPSKRNPHLRTKPPEQRRQELEEYIQDIIYQNEDVPQVLLDFLHLRHFHTGNKISSMESLDELDSQDYSPLLSNQRVVGFFRDPYVSDCISGLPDIIVDGVLQGFYPRDVRVSFTSPALTDLGPSPSIEA
ncbi:sorting nexin-22 isoform X2 [Echeneis naucrates]|uniref:sorting nexin-22 isoform X2 n=1 Tax=Echeneis naucrates TaxID=173247 RepID=UPI00111360E0|nr:sorting nexin-24-like isoform X2 [Echeneis naucrates]